MEQVQTELLLANSARLSAIIVCVIREVTQLTLIIDPFKT